MADVMVIEEALGNGLRPKRDMSRDPRYLREMLNMVPLGPRKARTLRQVTWPIKTTDLPLSMSFPFPQVLRDDKLVLVFEEDAVWLADTTAYPFPAAELTVYNAEEVLTNRRFDTDSDWILGNGWTIANGALTATGGISTDATAANGISTGTYLVTFTVTRTAGSIAAMLGTTAGTSRATSGTFTEVITTNGLTFKFAATGFTGTIDNVSVVKAYPLAAGGAAWQMTAWQDKAWFATNGTRLLFQLPHNPVDATAATIVQSPDDLSVNTVCKHNNALILGGLSGSRLATDVVKNLFAHWRTTQTQNQLTTATDTLDNSYIMYGDQSFTENDLPGQIFMAALGLPGSYEAALYEGIVYGLVEQKRIGFYRPRYCGEILCCKQVGSDLMVYGKNGVSICRRTENGYEETPLVDQGIPGRMCVGGDDKLNMWLGNRYDLWTMSATDGLTRLDYSEFMEDFTTPASVVITHDSIRGQFWITDGAKCYTHTGFGLGESAAVMPSSILRLSNDEVLFGSAITAADPQPARIVSSILDAPDKQTFEVSSLDVACQEASATAWTATVDWRLRQSDQFRRPTAIDVSDRGRCFVKKTGAEFRAVLYGANYKNVDVDRIVVSPSIGKPSLANIFNATDTILSETYK